MKLIIAEKPSVGMTIADVVSATTKKDGYIEGNGYIVSWCFGHLVELMNPDYYIKKDDTEENVRWNIDDLPIIPDVWQFTLADDKGVRKQFNTLKKLMLSEKVKTIICATDAGREGECIFRYVYDYAKCNKYVERLWVSSLEESAIREGLNCMKPDTEYDLLFESGFARAKADWLIGMNMTRVYSLKFNALKPVLSIGRVQTPTLAMIVDRYFSVNNFVKEYYYKVELDTDKGFILKSEKKYNSVQEAENVLYPIGEYGIVEVFEKKRQKKNPPPLFDLTLLQREANSQLGYTAQETLDILQKLYESKLVTYPRTDSNYITEDMRNTADELVKKLNALNLYQGYMNEIEANVDCLVNNKKVSDHHALLPTKQVTNETFEKLSDKESNILKLVCGRLLVAVAPAREYYSSKVIVDIEGKKYVATGKSIINDGYKVLETKIKLSKKESKKLEEVENIPELQTGEKIGFVNKRTVEQETKPLSLYNDNTLLKAMEIAGNEEYKPGMEKKGIGTPATRAGVLETLVSRGYIVREKKKIIPTERGINLISIVPNILKSAKTTATWESALQQIEAGEVSTDYFMERITSLTNKLTLKAKEENADTSLFEIEKIKIADCPNCGNEVLSYSKVWKCSECGFKVFKIVAGKKITDGQAQKLIKNGQTDKIKGFKNKGGKTFDAKLVLKENFEVSFKF